MLKLISARWKFLNKLSKLPKIGPEVVISGKKCLGLAWHSFVLTKFADFLKKTAENDDKDFFVGLFGSGVHFKGRLDIDVLAYSFLRESKLATLRHWLSITRDPNVQTAHNKMSLLHYAAGMGGKRVCSLRTRILLSTSR